MDLLCKTNGIDVDILHDEKVLSNKMCFWSLLQSYTDRLHHYYYDEEKHIMKSIKRLDQKNLLNHQSLRGFQKDVHSLERFIKLNVDLFVMIVRKFDEKHKTDTFDEELEYFLETYPFMEGHRLFNILEAIDAYIYDIECSSKDVRSGKNSSIILSIVNSLSEKDIVRCDSVNKKARSFKHLTFILKLFHFKRKRENKKL